MIKMLPSPMFLRHWLLYTFCFSAAISIPRDGSDAEDSSIQGYIITLYQIPNCIPY